MTRERLPPRRGCVTLEFDHARMTAEQFREMVESLGLTLSAAAVVLGVNVRTAYRWANNERKIPSPVSRLLRHLERNGRNALDEAIALLRANGYRVAKPRLKRKEPPLGLNAVGKPYSPQYDPKYRRRYKPSYGHLRLPYPSTMRFVEDASPEAGGAMRTSNQNGSSR
jgi:transcriptional regulator with XRE-family HTH domain